MLTSLAEVHSIALITDLDRPEPLILSLLTSAFDIVSGSAKTSSGEEVTKAVEGYLTQILVLVIDESATISSELTDVIIAQFLRVDPRTEDTSNTKNRENSHPKGTQSDLLPQSYPRAYEMAKAICASVPEKMTTFIGQYFSNIILDASEATQFNGYHAKLHSGKGSVGVLDDEAGDVRDLVKAHRLIRELWRACPDVLLHVIPQVEAELSAESHLLRLTATETLSDVAAGIGVAGFPLPVHVDPATYPPPRLNAPALSTVVKNPLQIPMSPKPFVQVHSSAYQSFLSRKQDKAASVRAAWASGAGRILLTSAGGIGFTEDEQRQLQAGLAQLLTDADEKVRLAAIMSVGSLSLTDVIRQLGPHGSVTKDGSVLATLSDRIRDRKVPVRNKAMQVLGQMWAEAAGEIERGNEEVTVLLGDIPSKLLDAYYVNDSEVHALLDRVIFEYLLPLNYPPIKMRASKTDGSQKQSVRSKTADQHQEPGQEVRDPDAIRARRMLTCVQGLDERAKTVFFGMQNRQTQFARVMAQYLRACEEYNGGVIDENEAEVQKNLNKWIDAISKTLPETSRVAVDLRKFAKLHDRRNYQLIRFCLNADSEYRTVVKAIKELRKRLEARPAHSPSLDVTIMPLLYRCSLLVYNRSHVPSIMKISRSDEPGGGLAETAHELLREISSRTPEVLKTHIQELCRQVETTAPNDADAEATTAVDMLNACAEFARRFPSDVPTERKFLVALSNYALFAREPRAAKHAVSILMSAGAAKKEMYAADLMRKATTDCHHDSRHFVTRLATISQVTLLDPKTADQQSETILRITTEDTIFKNRQPGEPAKSSPRKTDTYKWSLKPDQEALAKRWSLKCLINFLRSHLDESSFSETARPIYNLLVRLIRQEGEVTPTQDTPATQRPYLRLTAAQFLLKLCSQRRACEDLVTPSLFNEVALVLHDRLPEVRAGFGQHLKKLLAAERLNYRWYTMLFLVAFEPEQRLKAEVMAWLRSRSIALARRQQQRQPPESRHESSATKGAAAPGHIHGQHNTTEILLARLLSLLSHHPDFPDRQTLSPERFQADFIDFAHYIIFYLQSVANDENLSLIFHVAQRVKQTGDAITGTDEASERLYALSDLAQAVIRHYADLRSHQRGGGGGGGARDVNLLQTWPGKLRLPLSLFRALPGHDVAQRIAQKNYLPEEVAEKLERLVKNALKPARTTTTIVGSSRVATVGAPKHNERKKKTGGTGNRDAEYSGEDDEPTKGKGSWKTKKGKTSLSSASRAPSTLPLRKPRGKAPTSVSVGKKRKKAARDNDDGDEGDDDVDDSDRKDGEFRTMNGKERRAPRGDTAEPARKSVRRSGGAQVTSYTEQDSEQDDQEMQQWDEQGQKVEGANDDHDSGEDNDEVEEDAVRSESNSRNDSDGETEDEKSINQKNSKEKNDEELNDKSQQDKDVDMDDDNIEAAAEAEAEAEADETPSPVPPSARASLPRRPIRQSRGPTKSSTSSRPAANPRRKSTTKSNRVPTASAPSADQEEPTVNDDSDSQGGGDDDDGMLEEGDEEGRSQISSSSSAPACKTRKEQPSSTTASEAGTRLPTSKTKRTTTGTQKTRTAPPPQPAARNTNRRTSKPTTRRKRKW